MNTIPLFKVKMSPQVGEEVSKVLSSGYVGEGPKVKEFEEAFQKVIGSKVKPLMVNSGTSALTLALYLAGVREGDYVISTPLTCTATNLAILHLGAKILWADINITNGLIDPTSVRNILLWNSDKPIKAIMAVDWAGRHCLYNELKKFGIPVIQDAAHCLYIDNDDCGDYVCWSFQAIKFLTTCDGGAILTPADKHKEARLMRWFGLDREAGQSMRCRQNITVPGFKMQCTDVDAVIGLANIPLAVESVKRSKENAAYYDQELFYIPGLILPDPDNCQFWIYTIRVPERREEFTKYLHEHGVDTNPVHLRNDTHDVFAEFKSRNFLNLKHFDDSQTSIPVGWWVTDEDREYIVKTIKRFFSL